MGERFHIGLFVEGSRTSGTQAVPVEALGNDRFRVLCSPGLVEGIAAEDVIRITDERTGRFEVVERGGNVSIKVMGPSSVEKLREQLERELAPLGGWCDGGVEIAAVFTVPVRAGFPAIESVLKAVAASCPGFVWYFGNVYSEEDGVTPLEWWKPFLRGRAAE
jgi:hypothetical protein